MTQNQQKVILDTYPADASLHAISNLPVIFTGVVVDMLEKLAINEVVVQTAQGESLKAHVADGCLLPPQLGDKVLLMQDERGTAHVVIVSQRADSQAPVQLYSSSGMVVNTSKFEINAKEAVNIKTKTLHEEVVHHKQISKQLEVTTGVAEYSANTTHVAVGKFVGLIQQLSTHIRTALQRFNVLSREVDAVETNRATMRTDTVTGALTINAQTASIRSKSNLQINADQTLMN